jgi:hypothetical protein
MIAMAKPETSFQIRYRGRSWSGVWRAADGKVHVTSELGQKFAPVLQDRGSRVLAEMLLRQIVKAHLEGPPAVETGAPTRPPRGCGQQTQRLNPYEQQVREMEDREAGPPCPKGQ